MSDIRKSTTNHLLVTFLATATFLGSAELGLGQAANSSGADIYKAKCVSCHAADGRVLRSRAYPSGRRSAHGARQLPLGWPGRAEVLISI